MTQTVLDPCLLFKKKESELATIIETLVNDTLGAGSEEFSIEEEPKSSKFDLKPLYEYLPFIFG